MVHAVCPTDIVKAPIDIVWGLLTRPEDWGSFFDVRVLRADPPGSAVVGQIVEGASGRWPARFRLRFQFVEVDEAAHRLGVEVALPFGIVNHERLSCSAVATDACRVTYGCNFDFPQGLGGVLIRRLVQRAFEAGPADSLARLKTAAEGQWRRAAR